MAPHASDFLPVFTLPIIVRYLARLVLFPIMPYGIGLLAVYYALQYLLRLFQGCNMKSDARRSRLQRLPGRLRHLMPYTSSFETFFLCMRDGTRLAVDVWLPMSASEKKPVSVILHQARYYRSARMALPIHTFRLNRPYNLISQDYFESMLARGLAIVSFDVRGTGASFGVHEGPWRDAEIGDSHEVLEWVLKQPWCSGRVGLFGVSYEATAAINTTTLNHPAIKACVPLYPFLDIYDCAYMGGLRLHSFITGWQEFNDNLDAHRLDRFSWLSWLFFDHVSPVAGEPSQLQAALAQRTSNWRCTEEAPHVEYADDVSPVTGLTPLSAGPYRRFNGWVRQLRYNRAPAGAGCKPPAFFIMSGWYDTSASCAIRMARLLDGLTECKLVLGSWNHSGTLHVRTFPKGHTSLSCYEPYLEVADFLSQALDGCPSPLPQEPSSSCHYYTSQAEKWRSASVFPANASRGVCDSASQMCTSLYLHTEEEQLMSPSIMSPSSQWEPGARLRRQQQQEPGVTGAGLRGGGKSLLLSPHKGAVAKGRVEAWLQVDPTDATGDVGAHGISRYVAMIQPFELIHYTLEGPRINRLRFTSPPLLRDLEVTGFPVADLWVSSSAGDASIHVYLECVAEGGGCEGKGYYVTEGVFRASNGCKEVEPDPDDVRHSPGVPAHSFLRGDARALSSTEATRVRFALLPTSFRFKRGQRVRVSIGGADVAHFAPPKSAPGAQHSLMSSVHTLRVHMSPRTPSEVLLPTPGEDGTLARDVFAEHDAIEPSQ